MADSNSVTQWIDGLKEGDEDAAAKIWQRYGADLLQLASRKLGNTRKRVSDEEDVAMMAFQHFCAGVQDGRFMKLEGRDDLWHLLVVLTKRRSIDQVRRERRRNERGESVFNKSEQSNHHDGPANCPSGVPPAEVAVEAIEQCGMLLEHLQDEALAQIAVWKMEGFTNDEISSKLNVATRTVERKLRLIRQKWSELAASSSQNLGWRGA